jgi:sugar-specific transcriptional regulator TrmB
MSRPTSDTRDALAALGLTEVEADAYAFLVRNGPGTGYRIAQAIGRPVGNLYKSLESLESKGFAVSAPEASGRTYRAVPVREVGAAAVRAAERAAAEISRRLVSAPDAAPPDDRLYTIGTLDAGLARARAMIRDAQDFVVATACPCFVRELEADLRERAHQHVAVGVKAYAPAQIAPARLVLDPRGEPAWRDGPGQWLVLSADGREALWILTDHEGAALHSAHWTQNPMLNWAHYTGLSSDLLLAEARSRIASGVDAAAALDSLAALHRLESPASTAKAALRRRSRTKK